MRLCTHEAFKLVSSVGGDLGQLAQTLRTFGYTTLVDVRFPSIFVSGYVFSVSTVLTLSDDEDLVSVQHELVLQSYDDTLMLEAMLEGLERCLVSMSESVLCSCPSNRPGLVPMFKRSSPI